MKRIARSAIVPHSAEQVYAVVVDIESYPRFLPWCLAARVERRAQGATATLEVGLKGLRQSFTTLNENAPGRAIDMRLVPRAVRNLMMDGPYNFGERDDGRTKLEFSNVRDLVRGLACAAARRHHGAGPRGREAGRAPCAGDGAPRRRHHGAVEPALRGEHARRVDQDELHLVAHCNAAHQRARSLHFLRHGGDFCADERIHQSGLSRIGRA